MIVTRKRVISRQDIPALYPVKLHITRRRWSPKPGTNNPLEKRKIWSQESIARRETVEGIFVHGMLADKTLTRVTRGKKMRYYRIRTLIQI